MAFLTDQYVSYKHALANTNTHACKTSSKSFSRMALHYCRLVADRQRSITCRHRPNAFNQWNLDRNSLPLSSKSARSHKSKRQMREIKMRYRLISREWSSPLRVSLAIFLLQFRSRKQVREMRTPYTPLLRVYSKSWVYTLSGIHYFLILL